MKINWLTNDEMAIREVEHLLKGAKIKYTQVRIDNKYTEIHVSTYKRAKDTIKLLMDKSIVNQLNYVMVNARDYIIQVSFEFLLITQ